MRKGVVLLYCGNTGWGESIISISEKQDGRVLFFYVIKLELILQSKSVTFSQILSILLNF